MPGSPPTSPNFGAPRYDDSDDATFAEQVNPITDTFDALAVRTDDPRLTNARAPAPGSVVAASFAPGAVGPAALAAGAVTAAAIANGAVGSAQILDGSIANADLGANSVDARVLAVGGILTPNLGDAQVTLPKLGPNATAALNAPGDLIYSVATTRAGAVLCDGRAVSRSDPTYAALNAIAAAANYAAPWGPGDGSTTFTVPDYRGLAIVMADPNGAHLPINKPALGAAFGVESYALGVSEMPSHLHGVYSAATGISTTAAGIGVVAPFMLHGNAGQGTFNFGTGGGGGGYQSDPSHIHGINDPTHAHTLTYAGGSNAHPNVQPSAAVNVFVKL
jgi:microcystin-dependent protein